MQRYRLRSIRTLARVFYLSSLPALGATRNKKTGPERLLGSAKKNLASAALPHQCCSCAKEKCSAEARRIEDGTKAQRYAQTDEAPSYVVVFSLACAWKGERTRQ